MIAQQLEAQAVAFARKASNVDLSSWFARNRRTIETYVTLIQHFSGRQTGALSPSERASRALAALSEAIAARQPEQLPWVKKYRSLLSVCAEMIVAITEAGNNSPDAGGAPEAIGKPEAKAQQAEEAPPPPKKGMSLN